MSLCRLGAEQTHAASQAQVIGATSSKQVNPATSRSTASES